jgi:hypothetical protein
MSLISEQLIGGHTTLQKKEEEDTRRYNMAFRKFAPQFILHDQNR